MFLLSNKIGCVGTATSRVEDISRNQAGATDHLILRSDINTMHSSEIKYIFPDRRRLAFSRHRCVEALALQLLPGHTPSATHIFHASNFLLLGCILVRVVLRIKICREMNCSKHRT